MIRIYGASDDLVDIEGHPDGDEIGCYDRDVIVIVEDPAGGGIAVRMSYAPGFPKKACGREIGFGCWSAEVVQLAEDEPVPWPVAVKHAIRGGTVGYSVVVEIDAPATVALRHVVVPERKV